ncbi:hypothetical protein AN451_29265 [Pseudomonas aeruginosa]|nr:hypothetical protein AN451_29265 [Pseudomonas aeruginosa]
MINDQGTAILLLQADCLGSFQHPWRILGLCQLASPVDECRLRHVEVPLSILRHSTVANDPKAVFFFK